MRYAIISDLHSNMEAIKAVEKDFREKGADKVVCLGDLVGYGASPKELLDWVRSNCDYVIAGNHDHAVVDITDKDYFNPNAKKAVEWTQNQLDEEDLLYLKGLPMIQELEDFVCVHANLHRPSSWGYILDEFDADSTFAQMAKYHVCFIGHSHVPVVFEEDILVRYLGSFNRLALLPSKKYIINVGSVGQPRDGISESAYVIYDTSTQIVELVRVPYEIQKTQSKIISAGLPEFLAERIAHGR